MNSSATPIVEQYRTPLAASLLNQPGWAEADYSLRRVPLVTSNKITVIAANHHQDRNGPFPFFAVVADGSVVSNYDADAFGQIVAKSFRERNAADAPALARLSVLFGAFAPKVVGEFLDDVPRSTAIELPRPTAKVDYVQEGDFVVLRFYTNDFDLDIAYDCTVKIKGAAIEATAVALSSKSADTSAD